MTTTDHVTGRFPLSSALAWLAAAAMMAAVVGGAVFNWGYADSKDAGLALTLLTGSNWLIASLGLLLVAMVARQGAMVITVGYFAGASIRFIANLLVVSYLMIARQGDTLTVFIALAFAYLPLLAVEAGLIGSYLWRQDGAVKASRPDALPITEAVA